MLLPLFFVVHGYVEHYPVISVWEGLMLLAEYCAVTAVLWLLTWILLRNLHAAALLTFLLMAFHIFFGPIHDGLKGIAGGSLLSSYTLLLPLILSGTIFLLFYFIRRKPESKKLAAYANLLLLIFLLIDAVQLGSKASDLSRSRGQARLTSRCDTCRRPDVYLIIADGYAGNQSLNDIFNFDNSSFEKQMQSRGFHLVTKTKSNYNYTPFTISAILGMNYLRGLEGRNQSLSDRKTCYETINENAVTRFFSNQGYEFINLGVFRFAKQPPYHTTSFYLAGTDLVRAQTLFSRLNRDIRFNLVTRFKIRSEVERMAYEQKRLNEDLYKRAMEEISTPSTKAPRFIYIHLGMPHAPYYFNSKGKPYPVDALFESSTVNLEHYREYLQYSNQQYLRLIDSIQEHAATPPLVLFMSDHGFREYNQQQFGPAYQFMNINMVSLPGKKYKGFYEGMSTVNQFRVVLNQEFGQRLTLLKDSTILLSE